MEENEVENEQVEEENLIYINATGKDDPEISLDINNEIPIINIEDTTTESISLIKSTVDMLFDQLEFYKDELREKNLLIKTLNFRNANDGKKINMDLVNESNLSLVETTSKLTSNSSKTNSSGSSNYNSRSNDTDDSTKDNHTNEIYYTNTNSTRANLVNYNETLGDSYDDGANESVFQFNSIQSIFCSNNPLQFISSI